VNIYLLAALFSGIFYSISTIIFKISNKHLVSDPLRFGFLTGFARIPELLLLIPFISPPTKLSSGLILAVIFYSLIFFIGNILTVVSIKNLDVSVFSPLFNLQLIFTPLFAYFLLKERFSVVVYLLMGAVMVGGFLVTFSVHSKRRRNLFVLLGRSLVNKDFDLPMPLARQNNSSHWIALLILTLGLAFYSLSDNVSGYILKDWDALSLVFYSSIIQLFYSLFLIPFFGPKEDIRLKRTWPIMFHALFNFLGLLAINVGFSGSVSLTQTLSRLSTVYVLIFVVLLTRFNKDLLEDNPKYVYVVRFLGSGVMVASAIAILLLK